MESRYPEKLLKHLQEERKYIVEENISGIYTVKGDILPVQVIDSRRLSEEENLWLKSLDNRIDASALLKIDTEAGRLGKEELAELRAYLYVLTQANPKTAREAIEMSDSVLTIEQVFEEVGWTAKWEAKGEARGKAEGQRQVLAMLKNGKTIEEAEQILGLAAN